ncbi:MAG: hypothetical protein ABI333_20290 [bacterium]
MTHAMRDADNEPLTAIQPTTDDAGRPALQLYRNCPCGSTLLELFRDRRDLSPAGRQRRKRFGELLEQLEQSGLGREIGRSELRRFLRGEDSELIRSHINKLKDED